MCAGFFSVCHAVSRVGAQRWRKKAKSRRSTKTSVVKTASPPYAKVSSSFHELNCKKSLTECIQQYGSTYCCCILNWWYITFFVYLRFSSTIMLLDRGFTYIRPRYTNPAYVHTFVAGFLQASVAIHRLPQVYGAKPLYGYILGRNLSKMFLHFPLNPTPHIQPRVSRFIERVQIRVFLLLRISRGNSLVISPACPEGHLSLSLALAYFSACG